MRRNSKTKPESNNEIQMQVIPENFTEDCTVTASGNNTDVLLEKRKEEANKPLYLKRV
jgi:hypothetical protein